LSEKRREKRNSRKIPARLLEAGNSLPAMVHDLSSHGLKFRTTHHSPNGAMVKLLLLPDSPAPIPIEGAVCWCRSSGSGNQELGLRFESSPPDYFDLLLGHSAGGVERQMAQLSPMPMLLLDLMAMVNDPASSVRRIEEKIKTDQALVAYLLKTVNSPFYGLPKSAASIRQAIQIAGFSALRSVLLAYFTRQLTYLAGDRETQQRLWQHALAVALTAREAARVAGLDEEAVYTAGLLHDIGKAVLLAVDTPAYLPVLRETFTAAESPMRVESRRLGYSHVEAGLYVMEHWNFSQLQRDVVACHHSPTADTGNQAAVLVAVYANQLVTRQSGREPDPDEVCPLPPALQGVSPGSLLERALPQMQSFS
jgi:putative nucleotidyltransferase with HDIG domain